MVLNYRPWSYCISQCLCKKIRPFHETGQNPRLFFQTRSQCCIPSPRTTGPLVPENILKGFLPYMGMAAILVIWHRCGEQTFITPPNGGCIWNLAWLALWFLRRRRLKSVNNGHTNDRGYIYYKLTYKPKGSGSGELIYKKKIRMLSAVSITLNGVLKVKHFFYIHPGKMIKKCQNAFNPKKKKKTKQIRVLSAIILNGVLKLNNYFKT